MPMCQRLWGSLDWRTALRGLYALRPSILMTKPVVDLMIKMMFNLEVKTLIIHANLILVQYFPRLQYSASHLKMHLSRPLSWLTSIPKEQWVHHFLACNWACIWGIYLYAALFFQIFFDDSIRNIQTGKQMGLRTVLVNSNTLHTISHSCLIDLRFSFASPSYANLGKIWVLGGQIEPNFGGWLCCWKHPQHEGSTARTLGSKQKRIRN